MREILKDFEIFDLGELINLPQLLSCGHSKSSNNIDYVKCEFINNKKCTDKNLTKEEKKNLCKNFSCNSEQ